MSKTAPVFLGTVTKGKVKLQNTNAFAIYLASLEGEEIQLVVEKFRTKRSLAQNKYYWKKVVGMIAEKLGITAEDTHEALKSLFLTKPIHFGAVELSVTHSTTSLNSKEFEEYMAKCRALASADPVIALYIPKPNEPEDGWLEEGSWEV